MRAHPVVTAIVAWTIIGALRIQHSYIYLIYRNRFTAARFLDAVQYDAVGALLWLLLTPGIFALARIIPFRQHRLWLRILAADGAALRTAMECAWRRSHLSMLGWACDRRRK